MANKNLVLRLLITAKDEASSIFGSLQSKAAGVASAIAAYFSVNFLAGVIKDAGDFEAALSRVKAATGASAQEMAALKKAAEEAGANTKFTSVEAAQALENLAKSGLTANKAIAALPAVLSLAEAGDVSLAESASYVTRTVSGMGVAVEEAGRIADVLAKGANASNTSVKGLAEALSYAAPSARSLGLSLEQTVGYIGKFADAGIDASRAGTALNAILSQFQDPASKFRTELTAAGITTSNFDQALRQLVVSGKGGEKAILAVGTEAGPALRGLINQGLGALDDLTKQLTAAKGSAAETAQTMGDNLPGAISGLSSAWDALKIKLGEPALAVVTQGVKDLTAAFKAAIDNGTITRFGEAIRSGLGAAIEWARKFAAEVDPTALAAKLEANATKIGVFFDAAAEKARNAGDVVRTVYGVMSGGVNVVMASIYKMGGVFSIIAASLLKDFSLIAAGLSKITFGGVSGGFKAAAEEIRISAIGMVGVAAEYGRQAELALSATVEGAELARKGWAGLTAPTGAATESVKAAGTTAREASADIMHLGNASQAAGDKASVAGAQHKAAATAAAEKVKELRAEYDKLVAGGDTQGAAAKLLEIKAALKEVSAAAAAAGSAMASAGGAQKAAADSTKASVKELRAEYDKLVAGGDAQGAVEKLKEINTALQSTKATAKDAADALTAAYQAMGLKSQADLKAKADEFKRHYEAIKADGTATADIISKAFQAYAEKAIEANGGVVSASLKTEAAMRGLSIQADGASVSVTKIGEAGKSAGAGVASGMAVASNAISKMRSDAERAADRLQALKSASLGDGHGNQSTGNGSYEDLRRAGVTSEQMRGMGYSAREIEDYVNKNDQAQPGFVNRTVTTSAIDTYSLGVEKGLNDAEAKKFGEIYNYYIAAANTRSRGRAAGTLGLGFGVSDYMGEQQIAVEQAVAEAKRLVSDANRKEGKAGAGGDTFWGAPRSVTINLKGAGGKETRVQVANQAQADDLIQALREAGVSLP
ncbi:MAG: phage tail tape measure protein [Opitutaceae bacterium]|nr:phage tail tape measure protein [Opitutaceae bacterium]